MPVEEGMEVRSTIQQIAVKHRQRYGYRRIAAERRRRGMLVSHKRVARIIARGQPTGRAAAGRRCQQAFGSRVRGVPEPGLAISIERNRWG
jgi:hypothetical protein